MSGQSSEKGAFRVYVDRPIPEIEEFVGIFFDGWWLAFPDMHTLARMYINGLSLEQKRDLKRELIRFYESRKSSRALKKAWIKLGAGWPKELDIHATLRDFIDML